MRWELKSTDVRVPENLKERIDRRLRFSLSRFGDRVDRIVVFLRDLNGPKGGIDKSVRVLVRIEGVGIALAMVVDSEWEIAVDRAADRIGMNVARQIIRHRQRSSRPWSAGV